MNERDPDRLGASTRAQFLKRSSVVLVGTLATIAGVDGCGRSAGKNELTAQDIADLEDLRKVDPKLIRYHEVGRIETGFAEARGIALGSAGLYVAGDHSIALFDAAGAPKQTIAIGGAPECLAVTTEGTVYAGVGDHVEVYDAQGRRTASWPALGERAIVTSVAAGGDDVWAADAGNRVVLRYDKNGAVGLTLGKKDAATNYPGLIAPSPHLDVACGKDGEVYVGNPGEHRIETWTRDGKYISSWGVESMEIEGFCGCCNPTDFALLPDGRFVTTEKGLPRVKVYGSEGHFEGVVESAEKFAEDAAGLDVAADRKGRIYVLDPKTKTVRMYEKNG